MITNNGDNLPRNGQLDGAFLDLPSDQTVQDKVKKGSLTDAVAYIHAKPGVTGNYTDIIIWSYYPFNGASKLQVGPFTIPLGKAGEHVSDWEHMRLRIDNVSWKLTSVYLSQHTKGKWLQANEFEYLNGRPVVYASLHGHLCSTETGTAKGYGDDTGTGNGKNQKFKIRERHRYGNKNL
ncbi:vacuolar protein sorting-associated protein 62 [Tanacetum coccineum]